MADKKSSEKRRKLLKSIAAGSSAIIAGKSLPENWSRPVVDAVMLPAHAQTSPAPEPQCEQNPLSFTAEFGWNDGSGEDVLFVLNPGFDGASDTAALGAGGTFGGSLYASGGNCANGNPVEQDGTYNGTLNTTTGAVSGSFTHRILCGGTVICTASGNFSGTALDGSVVPVTLSSVTSECCPDSTVVFPVGSGGPGG
jgi:hypothetical protein